MKTQVYTEENKRGRARSDARTQLLTTLPVAERRLPLSGVSTAVLEGGDGPSMVLLHGPGESSLWWMRIIPDLVKTHAMDGHLHVINDARDDPKLERPEAFLCALRTAIGTTVHVSKEVRRQL